MASLLNGNLRVDAPWQITRSERIVIDLLPGEEGVCQLALEETQPVWRVREFPSSFEEDEARAAEEFNRFADTVPTLPEKYAEARRLAAYVTWSGVVEPQGFLNWPAMFMSKNWMNNVWSWDHCFNAMALTYKHPAMAWDQLRVVFDQQDMYGALPDSVNDRSMVFSFVKPPIHGLTLAWMLERTSFIRKEQLHQIYGPLCRWTEWWFSYRDYDNDGIPQYHHGNDSGWDNATVFDVGMPLESPDLSAFLILQMETLGAIAARLGHPEEAESWQRRSEELLEKMLAHFWQGDHFVALRSGDHLVSDTDSLLLYLPLILGRRLPAVVRSDLVSGLTRPGRFITPYGLASEITSFTALRARRLLARTDLGACHLAHHRRSVWLWRDRTGSPACQELLRYRCPKWIRRKLRRALWRRPAGPCLYLDCQCIPALRARISAASRAGGSIMRKALPLYSANLLFFLTMLLVILLGSLVQTWNLSWGLLITEFVLIALPAVLFLRQRRIPLKRGLRLNPISPLTAVLCVLLGFSTFLFSVIIEAVMAQITGMASVPVPESSLPKGLVELAVYFIALAAAAPICEEILFRGVIQTAYETNRSVKFAILITATMFAFYHMRLSGLPGLLPVAFILSYVAWRTQSILATMLIHFGMNATSGANTLVYIVTQKGLPFLSLWTARRVLWRPWSSCWSSGVYTRFRD